MGVVWELGDNNIAGNIGSMRCIVNNNINVGYHVAVLGFVGGIL